MPFAARHHSPEALSDHTITDGLYVEDPDGNEVELNIDAPGVDWRSNKEAILAPIRPLHL